MEMYIKHIKSNKFNVTNTQIVHPDDHYISPTDVTRILPSNPTVFDIDYIPETKVEPSEEGNISSYALTESLGSNLGEIVFPAPVKQEPPETLEKIISSHSGTCQLRIQITDTYSVKNGSSSQIPPELDWSLDTNAPASSNTINGSQDSTNTNSQDGHLASPTESPDNSQDVTNMPMYRGGGSKELPQPDSIVHPTQNSPIGTDSVVDSALQELTLMPVPFLGHDTVQSESFQEQTQTGYSIARNSQEVTTPQKPTDTESASTVVITPITPDELDCIGNDSVLSSSQELTENVQPENISVSSSQEVTTHQKSTSTENASTVVIAPTTPDELDHIGNDTELPSSQELTENMQPANASNSSDTIIMDPILQEPLNPNEILNTDSIIPRITHIKAHLSNLGLL